jgi:hypothetical protein
MRVFLSHVSDEAPEARALKEGLEKALPGVHVFVSAIDIHLGDAWLKEIDQALTGAKAVLALCSPNSVRRPWLNFESGSGWSKGLPVIPLCHKGMRKDRLLDPMHIFQAVELTSSASCTELVTRLAALLGASLATDFDAQQMFEALKSERPPRGTEIGIVLCYGQNQWEQGDRSVFALVKLFPNGLDGNWILRSLEDERVFLSADLHKFSGLIVANPLQATMEPETITAIVEWVRAGGRLLLLGFELGDWAS